MCNLKTCNVEFACNVVGPHYPTLDAPLVAFAGATYGERYTMLHDVTRCYTRLREAGKKLRNLSLAYDKACRGVVGPRADPGSDPGSGAASRSLFYPNFNDEGHSDLEAQGSSFSDPGLKSWTHPFLDLPLNSTLDPPR